MSTILSPAGACPATAASVPLPLEAAERGVPQVRQLPERLHDLREGLHQLVGHVVLAVDLQFLGFQPQVLRLVANGQRRSLCCRPRTKSVARPWWVAEHLAVQDAGTDLLGKDDVQEVGVLVRLLDLVMENL